MNPLVALNAPELDLSVVIAAWNAEEVLGAQLDALITQSWEGSWEILVVDNASSDGTAALAHDYVGQSDGRVRVVDAHDAQGVSHARNVGLRAARGRAVAFCDADDVVEAGWVAAMGDTLRESTCVGGRMKVDRLNPEWLHQSVYTNVPDSLETFAGVFAFSPTCNLGVHRDLALRIGGFDEHFPTGGDIEFCLRLWDAGEELAYASEATIQYRYRQTLWGVWQRSREYGATTPMIASRLASMGLETPPRLAGLRQWVWLARRLPILRTKPGRARWLVVAGTKLGRLEGSVRARRLVL